MITVCCSCAGLVARRCFLNVFRGRAGGEEKDKIKEFARAREPGRKERKGVGDREDGNGARTRADGVHK